MLGIEPADVGLPEREFIRHIDTLLETGQFNPDIIEYLDYKQQYTINTIKKYYARKRNKERGLEDNDYVCTKNYWQSKLS